MGTNIVNTDTEDTKVSGTNIKFGFDNYNSITYQDGGVPPINAQNLNRYEDALEALLGKGKQLQTAFESVDAALSAETTARTAADSDIKDRFNKYIGIPDTYENIPTTTNHLPENKSVSQYIYDIDVALKNLLGVDSSKTYDPTNNDNYLPTDKSVAQHIAEIKEGLQDNIDAETSRAESEESTLTSNLNTEISRAQGVEGELQGNIEAEATARGEEDEAIRDFIGSLPTDTTVNTVIDYVDTEVSNILTSLTLNVIIDGGTSEGHTTI